MPDTSPSNGRNLKQDIEMILKKMEAQARLEREQFEAQLELRLQPHTMPLVEASPATDLGLHPYELEMLVKEMRNPDGPDGASEVSSAEYKQDNAQTSPQLVVKPGHPSDVVEAVVRCTRGQIDALVYLIQSAPAEDAYRLAVLDVVSVAELLVE